MENLDLSTQGQVPGPETHASEELSQARCLELNSWLRSWATLQPHITDLDSESEIIWMMKSEQNGRDRIRILERLLSRYNKLRHERERRELQAGILPQ